MTSSSPKLLRRLIGDLDLLEVRGSLDVAVREIVIDSRQSGPGILFGAFPGLRTDGHRFVEGAVAAGAVAVIHSAELDVYSQGCCYLKVKDSRRALSRVAAAFHDHPSRELFVTGVTGTDGKSTTVWLIHQLLESIGRPNGFFSSVYLNTDGVVRPNPHHTSTPEAHQVQRILATIRDSGRRYAIVEATSHGLSAATARLADVGFDVAVLTNVHQEHLEFHGTVEQYRADKATLFSSLKPGNSSYGVINLDDRHWELFSQAAAPHPVLTYSLREDSSADMVATAARLSPDGSTFRLRWGGAEVGITLGLPGLFNIQNFMAAALAVGIRDHSDLERLAGEAPRLSPPRGRLQPIDEGQPFAVLVDFAHTPNSFGRILPFMKNLTRGRLLVVFGSAGERDVAKRPLQGQIASEHADVVVITDEDPRGEERMAIINQIAAGCRGPAEIIKIADRETAIRKAVVMAEAGDTILCLGKGHETSIEMPMGPVEWDEAAVVRKILREL